MATTIISPPTVLSDQAQAEGLTLSLFERCAAHPPAAAQSAALGN
jgi:hypothetical protein